MAEKPTSEELTQAAENAKGSSEASTKEAEALTEAAGAAKVVEDAAKK